MYIAEAAETVLANASIQWACRTIDFIDNGEKIHYPIKRICRLRDRYLLFLYKLFLEYRGRIPFNNANLAQTSCSEVEFCFNGKSFENALFLGPNDITPTPNVNFTIGNVHGTKLKQGWVCTNANGGSLTF